MRGSSGTRTLLAHTAPSLERSCAAPSQHAQQIPCRVDTVPRDAQDETPRAKLRDTRQRSMADERGLFCNMRVKACARYQCPFHLPHGKARRSAA